MNELRWRRVLAYKQKQDREKDGYGFGLAIVDRIAKMHKCEVTIENDQILGGLKVSLIIPVVTIP